MTMYKLFNINVQQQTLYPLRDYERQNYQSVEGAL